MAVNPVDENHAALYPQATESYNTSYGVTRLAYKRDYTRFAQKRVRPESQ